MKNIYLLILFSVLGFYLVYEQVMDCQSISLDVQRERHENFMQANSDFFNPWQYRIFGPLVLEAFIRGWDAAVSPFRDKLPFKQMQPFFAYFFLRFLQNILICFAAFKYYNLLGVKSTTLVLSGILLLGYNISNSTFGSDLSVNTYFDVLFYLVAGILILRGISWLILPLTFFAALNRETSAFIPVMFLLFNLQKTNWKIPSKKVLLIFGCSMVSFVIAYVAPRVYFGTRPYHGINGVDTPMEFLKFNLTFGSLFPELFGTLGFVFLLALIKYRVWNPTLKLLFWLIVPFWFVLHFSMSQAMETRLFLVPQALIFIPALLWVIYVELNRQKEPII